MITLFLAWQDQAISRRWFVVGRLDQTVGGGYSFRYLNQAQEARDSGLELIPDFPLIDTVYHSDQLFPLFANRLLPKSRPDYGEFLQRIGVEEADSDPLTILSRTEGIRMTDGFEVFPKPERDSLGRYHVVFFARGVRHLETAEDCIQRLQPGDRLRVVCDDGSDYDCNALLISRDGTQVGWVPRYFCKDVRRLLEDTGGDVVLEAMRVNLPPAPVQQRLLCALSAPWPTAWIPFSDEEFQPIVGVEDLLPMVPSSAMRSGQEP